MNSCDEMIDRRVRLTAFSLGSEVTTFRCGNREDARGSADRPSRRLVDVVKADFVPGTVPDVTALSEVRTVLQTLGSCFAPAAGVVGVVGAIHGLQSGPWSKQRQRPAPPTGSLVDGLSGRRDQPT